MKSYKSFLSVISACLICGNLAAGGPGTTGANFLKIQSGARPAALGGAFVSLADDANAIAYNPAGLERLSDPQATFSYNQQLEGINQNWLSGAYPLGNGQGTLGLGLNMVSVKPFSAYDENDQPAGNVSASNMALSVGYGRRIPMPDSLLVRTSGGAAFKYINQSLSDAKATAMALDLGFLIKPVTVKGLQFGLALQNLGTSIKFDNQKTPLPRQFRAGAHYQLPLDKWTGNHQVGVSLEATLPKDGNAFLSLGTEYWFLKSIAARIGYVSDKNQVGKLALGIGLSPRALLSGRKAKTFEGLEFDYAFVGNGDLNNTHRLSLTWRFDRETAKESK